MIRTLNLKAGIPLNIALIGRYLNILVAAGNIRVEASGEQGGKFNSELYKGCAITLVKDFDAFSFTSDVEQQVKVWISQHPMTTIASSIRSIGSENLSAYNRQLFFNQRVELVPARPERGSVRIQPKTSLIIGGEDISLEQGFALNSGESIKLDTQGAIYGLCSDPTVNAVEVPDLEGGGETTLLRTFERTNGKEFGDGFFVQNGSVMLFIKTAQNYIYYSSDGVNFTQYDTGLLRGASYWVPAADGVYVGNCTGNKIQFIPQSGYQPDESRAISAPSHHYADIVGSKVAVLNSTARTLYYSDDGETFSNITPTLIDDTGHTDEQANLVKICETGRIYATFNAQHEVVYWSDDYGTNWTNTNVFVDWANAGISATNNRHPESYLVDTSTGNFVILTQFTRYVGNPEDGWQKAGYLESTERGYYSVRGSLAFAGAAYYIVQGNDGKNHLAKASYNSLDCDYINLGQDYGLYGNPNLLVGKFIQVGGHIFGTPTVVDGAANCYIIEEVN
ncbi:hypothetical protein AAOGI_06780 [Agarivorans albus]